MRRAVLRCEGHGEPPAWLDGKLLKLRGDPVLIVKMGLPLGEPVRVALLHLAQLLLVGVATPLQSAPLDREARTQVKLSQPVLEAEE